MANIAIAKVVNLALIVNVSKEILPLNLLTTISWLGEDVPRQRRIAPESFGAGYCPET
jgi:hypothetical protein